VRNEKNFLYFAFGYSDTGLRSDNLASIGNGDSQSDTGNKNGKRYRNTITRANKTNKHHANSWQRQFARVRWD